MSQWICELNTIVSKNMASSYRPGDGDLGRMLTDLAMDASFIVPLRVGTESFGFLLIMDIMDAQGTHEILAPAAETTTISLVEDEPSLLKMTTMMLKKMGYTVLAAGAPGEAVRLAREHADRIDLLMTDVVMPEMNGRDLAHNLLSTYPKLKILFMSGYTANVIAHHCVLDKAVRFIQKPFSQGPKSGKPWNRAKERVKKLPA